MEQTEDLETQSYHFKKQSNKLYWAVIRKNIKLIIFFGIILIVSFCNSLFQSIIIQTSLVNILFKYLDLYMVGNITYVWI